MMTESTDTDEQVTTGQHARHGPERPDRIFGHTVLMTCYAGAFTSAIAVAHRRAPDTRRPAQSWSDLVLVGVSTYKLSRLLTKQTVTTPLRAPFASDEGPAGAGERSARPLGSGLRHSVGELVTCPFCLDVWIASAGTIGLRIAPAAVRPVLSAFAAVAIADLLQFVHVRQDHAAAGSH